ncbi:MAG: spore coat U domain-containing protein [Candidatus Binatia bacterium]
MGRAFLMLLVSLAVAAPAWAGSTTANLSVGASVTNNCIISTTATAFGAYDPIVTNKTAPLDSSNGKVTITCAKGTTATIGLGAGLNAASATGTSRALSDGTSTQFLNYELYNESSRTTVWTNSGTGLLSPAAAPSRAARDFMVYGRVPADQNVPSGTYSDTVLVTINF